MRGYLGLGSNVGDRRANLQAAVDALPAHGVIVLACSSTYDTDPVGEILDQPSFLNACARIETALAPEELLDACKAIEGELGRDLASTVRHAPRPIDVDLLLLGDEPYASERLTLPHAQATQRRFVLIPLLELDFDLTTPDGTRLSDCLAAMPLDEGVRREGPPLRLPASGERTE
jgi:2-amino-4-hydroxy-6-hydroxymethyldihydropteridine diphosphokinase